MTHAYESRLGVVDQCRQCDMPPDHPVHQVDDGPEAALLRDLHTMRVLLWSTHPCTGKYGDDGELQCSECRIDFLRAPIVELETGVQLRSLEWLRHAQWHVCEHCGVTRFTLDAASTCPRHALGHVWKRSVAEVAEEDARILELAAKRLRATGYARGLGGWLNGLLVGALNGRAGVLRARGAER